MEKHKVKVFAVSGIKNSGKTTLIEKIVSALAEKGIKVGVIKHDDHEFTADHEGTDSFRHKQAGAENVIVYSKTKVMMIKEKAMPSVEELIELQKDMDVIILEGMKYSDFPKLEIVREGISCQSVCKKETLLALVTNTALRIEGVKTFELNNLEGILEVVMGYMNEPESIHDRSSMS